MECQQGFHHCSNGLNGTEPLVGESNNTFDGSEPAPVT